MWLPESFRSRTLRSASFTITWTQTGTVVLLPPFSKSRSRQSLPSISRAVALQQRLVHCPVLWHSEIVFTFLVNYFS